MARAIFGILLSFAFCLGAISSLGADADVSGQEHKFVEEVASLKNSLASKDLKESDLLSQLSQLQKEAKKLQGEAKQNSELKGKYDAVSKELGDTKDTLSNLMGQLAEKSTSISETERRVAEATKKLEGARLERDEAKEKLSELETISQNEVKAQKVIEDERTRNEELEGELSKLKDENSKLSSELAESQKAAKIAEREISKWQSKAEKAEKNVAKAEKTLEKALQEHTATQSALIKAEAKAEEAMKKVEGLLTSWLPHWLEDRYSQLLLAAEPALKHIQPVLRRFWAQSKSLAFQGKAKATWAYGVSKSKSQTVWKEAKPRLDQTWKQVKKQSHAYTKHAGKVAGPYFQQLKLQLVRTYNSASQSIAQFLDRNPTVLKLRRNAKQTLRELETLAIKYLKQVPFLKEYAKRPTVTYLVYAVLAAPLITILAPLLLLKGEKPRAKRQSPPSRGSAAVPEPAMSDKNGKGNKSKKARRISVGEEHIRVP